MTLVTGIGVDDSDPGEFHRILHVGDQISKSRFEGVCSLCGPVVIYKRGIRYGCSEQEKRRTIKRKYDVWPEEVPGEPGVCAVCRTNEDLCVDHDHHTGEPRGWLCKRHNSMLGLADDNPVILQRAVQYLLGELREG